MLAFVNAFLWSGLVAVAAVAILAGALGLAGSIGVGRTVRGAWLLCWPVLIWSLMLLVFFLTSDGWRVLGPAFEVAGALLLIFWWRWLRQDLFEFRSESFGARLLSRRSSADYLEGVDLMAEDKGFALVDRLTIAASKCDVAGGTVERWSSEEWASHAELLRQARAELERLLELASAAVGVSSVGLDHRDAVNRVIDRMGAAAARSLGPESRADD